ncbi:hypothetical protein SmJEL517_g01238 [Synchytrium microbalum]|uniref:Uncharacterized protein n=1 Tax=Synchytrium microbalum TaxID=1806994 RepID=A0A507CB20_9FUNG|nr:uncharacterized protein SmJEL517_g01238 [Synchytrium microbalum]TPX36548.1 hypothetical protein SmJEL517_g01238 [Synchytrium microbalum]
MSLFDALDESSARNSTKNQPIVVVQQNHPKYYGSNSLETPIFSLDKVQFQFPGMLLDLVVSNNILVVALEGNVLAKDGSKPQKILRIDLNQAHAVEEMELVVRQKGDKIRRLFFNPLARHLLISMESGDNFYLFEKWKKPRILNRIRGVIIESVAWGRPRQGQSELLTGAMLIGSRQGHIFESELHATEEFFKRGEERYFKQVYTLHEDNMPITGLVYEKFPASPRKYVVAVTTPDRMYQFIGNVADGNGENGLFGELFRKYDVTPSYQEISGQLTTSEFHCWSPFVESNGYPSLPKTFAWLTAPGIYFGNFVFGSQNVGDSIIDNAQLLPYQHGDNDETFIPPTSIALTEFHFIVLIQNKVQAVCILNNELVYEELVTLEPNERVLKMAVDPAKNTCWVYTNLSLFELVKSDEDRNIWKIHLERKAFDAAMSFAKSEEQKDKIATAQADYYFAQQRYALSATYYAQSKSVPFEDVVLRFLAKNERDALKVFLLSKLQRMPRQDVTQITLLCTWLVELMLSKLNTLRDAVEETNYSVTRQQELNKVDSTQELDDLGASLKRAEEEEKLATDEFKQFLTTYKDRLDRKTVYSLLSSHGRTHETLFYAELIGDSERVVSHWVNVEQWKEALKALERQSSVELYYKYSPMLIQNTVLDTVNAWIKQSNLNPRHLIPALLKYEAVPLRNNQAIRYLQHVINNLENIDPVVHNYLLSLYVLDAKNDDEAALLQFLRSQREDPHYDVQYALRVCMQHGLTQACIYIYGAMGLYEQAVDWSLETNDLELARIYADKPEDDDTLRRRLWLRIARHVVEKRQDIKQLSCCCGSSPSEAAIEFLRLSQLLKIEDILPFLPDFVLIDDFKEEICAALEDYNTHIESLKSEMDEATKSAESIRQDIRELRNKCAIVRISEKCQVCHLSLITRQFYIFPCEHGFHADCLIKLVLSNSGPRQAKRIQDLQVGITREMTSRQSVLATAIIAPTMKKNGSETASQLAASGISASKKISTEIKNNIERMKEELDVVVASECALCGEAMIKSIEKPFIGDDELRTVESWAV